MSNNKEEIREFIRKNYAQVAAKGASGCGCSSGCCGSSIEIENSLDINLITESLGYQTNQMNDVPEEANMGLGCGNPISKAALREGEVVLDLGSGGGIDCFLARSYVGDSGLIIGVDMTPEMIKLARDNARKGNYTNVEFRLGEIENLPLADQTVDVIISNCVINLSLDKDRVFKEAYRVLKKGGRLCISDIMATAELPKDIKEDLAMIAGCIAGAENVDTIREIMQAAGFKNIRMTPKDNSRELLQSWVPEKNLADYLASFIIQADKL